MPSLQLQPQLGDMITNIAMGLVVAFIFVVFLLFIAILCIACSKWNGKSQTGSETYTPEANGGAYRYDSADTPPKDVSLPKTIRIEGFDTLVPLLWLCLFWGQALIYFAFTEKLEKALKDCGLFGSQHKKNNNAALCPDAATTHDTSGICRC